MADTGTLEQDQQLQQLRALVNKQYKYIE